MLRSTSISRVAERHLARHFESGFEGAPVGELFSLQRMLASQVPSMDAESVAYATYVTSAFRGGAEAYVYDLRKAVLAAYRKHLIDWMKYGLLKRANQDRGGPGIGQITKGLARWVMAIPSMLTDGTDSSLGKYLPDTEYFVADRLDPIAKKILGVVERDAKAAGFLGAGKTARRRQRFTVEWDDAKRQWFVPFARDTFDYYDQFVVDGFKASKQRRRWEYGKIRLSPHIQKEYDVKGGPEPRTPARPVLPTRADPAPPGESDVPLHDWFFDTWLPKNINRFTTVFTDYASTKIRSYQLKFSVKGGKVKVQFKRDINTAAEAVEELRYRYTGRQGRGPWLETMDRFIDLVGQTTPNEKLMLIIDRMNNLQHSNGLFMEHWPKSVQSWYFKFLNAKYHTPKSGYLAKFIPDRDVRNVLMELSQYLNEGFKPPGWQDAPAPTQYQDMGKEPLNLLDPPVNWREKGYPYAPGKKQIDRTNPAVRRNLRILEKYDVAEDTLGSMDPDFLEDAVKLIREGADWRQRALGADNIPLAAKGPLERVGVPENQIRSLIAPLEGWAREFKSLGAREPSLPTQSSESRAYKTWIDTMARHDKERGRLEKKVRAVWDEFVKKRDEAAKAQQDYFRSVRPDSGGDWRDRLAKQIALRYAARTLNP